MFIVMVKIAIVVGSIAKLAFWVKGFRLNKQKVSLVEAKFGSDALIKEEKNGQFRVFTNKGNYICELTKDALKVIDIPNR